jgi:glycosyltransferase involved in cell wall biosynthesis
MPDSIRALAGNGIVTAGFVEDIDPLIDAARVSIAPLRYGAGVKGKINQAMACGLPVVATSVAVEGMSLMADEEILVADKPQDFADEIVRLYGDSDLWHRLAERGYENVQTHFSRATAKKALEGLFV